MFKTLATAAALSLAAISANAATLTIELWDVLAGPSTCCSPNPSVANQEAARQVDTGNTVLANPANPFNANYLPAVNGVIAGESAHLAFNIDSSLLTTGFFVNGVTGLGGQGQSLNSFFGFDIDGAGPGIGNNSVLGTILRITGFVDVVVNDAYSVRSDDGYSIAIGGAPLVQNDGLQAPTTTNHVYGGAAGIQAFTMLWFDNQITQSALRVTGLKFAAVPLPAAGLLLLVGLGGLAAVGRRRTPTPTA